MEGQTEPTLGELSHQIDGLSHQMDEIKQALSQLKEAADDKSPFINKSDFLLHEYDALKSEVVQRIVTRYTIISMALVALGAVFTIQNPYLDLLFPLIALALLIVYITNARSIHNIGNYIKDNIEDQVSENGTEAINRPLLHAESTHPSGNVVQNNIMREVAGPFGWQNTQVHRAHIRAIGFSASRWTFAISAGIATIVGIFILFLNNDPKNPIPPDRYALNLAMSIASGIIVLITVIMAIYGDQFITNIEQGGSSA